MIPIRRGDGTGLSVPGFSEVRTGDGRVLWTEGPDIPDSVVAQYDAREIGGTDGDTVTAWPDETGAYNLSGGDPTLRDNAINGNRAVEFDGTNDSLDNTDSENVVSETTTIFVVAEHISGVEGYIFTSEGDFSSPNLLVDNEGVWDMGGLKGSSDLSTQLFTLSFDGSNSEFREDGTTVATGDLSGTEPLYDIIVGDDGFDRWWNGYIGFIEIHEGTPSAGINNREDEIAAEWGITI